MGTYHWMAPEIFDKSINQPYTNKSDMYAFSIIMWEILAQKTPYHELENYQEIVKFVYQKNGRPSMEDIEEQVNPELLELIEHNWDQDSNKRMNFRDVIPKLEKIFVKCLVEEEQNYVTN